MLDNAGSYLLVRGRYNEIELLYQRALSIYERNLGPEHLVVAGILNNLGMLYVSQGQYAKADPVYRRALATREKELGPAHLYVASSLNNLAILAVKQGQYEAAEARFERALTIQETVLGSDHPDVARKRNNLASLYYNQGKYAPAERLFERSLATLEKALGPEHLDVAGTLNGPSTTTWSRHVGKGAIIHLNFNQVRVQGSQEILAESRADSAPEFRPFTFIESNKQCAEMFSRSVWIFVSTDYELLFQVQLDLNPCATALADFAGNGKPGTPTWLVGEFPPFKFAIEI